MFKRCTTWPFKKYRGNNCVNVIDNKQTNDEKILYRQQKKQLTFY